LRHAHLKRWSKYNGGKKLNIRNKKINAFGKSIPVIAIVLMILTAGIAGAVLVNQYFTTSGKVTVIAPLSVNEPTYTVNTEAGNTHNVKLTVNNAAKVAIPTNLITSANPDISVTYLDANGVPIVQPIAIMPGTTEITARIEINPALASNTYTITTTAEPVANRKALILENKDPANAYTVINDNTVATLIYNPSGNEFEYALVGSGLKPLTEYSLIYYADEPDRFVDWGGNNPGALIGSGTTTGNGNLVMDDSINLNMNLPCPPDSNIDGEDYRDTDGYSNAHGAKLWLVPSSLYSENTKMIIGGWNPTEYLFETDLISYIDTNA